MEEKQQLPSDDCPATNTATAAAAAATTIDDLPDQLILNILSFLPTLDTITTSLISKKWYPLWSINPSLHFSFSQFPPYKSPSTTRQFFAQFIDRTLVSRSQNSPLSKFRLQFIFEDRFRFHVDSWIRYAIKNRAQDIDLDFFIDKCFFFDEPYLHDTYDFPFSVLKNGKVRVLKLTRCDLTLPSDVSRLCLFTLNSIYLDQIYLTDQMCLDLISGCPNLEFLELANCYGMDNLMICSRKLKELELKYFICDENECNLEIDCPNLLKLSIVWFEVGKCCFKNLFNLVQFRTSIGHKCNEYYGYWSKVVSLLDQMPQIKSLSVQNWWFKLAPREVFFKDFILYNLKQLELQTGYTQYDLLGMEALLELTPNVETLILDFLFKIDTDESLSEDLLSRPINLSMPNLKEVKMKQFRRTADEGNFLLLLRKQGLVLEKIVVVPAKVGDTEYAPIVFWKRSREIEAAEGTSPSEKIQ